MDMIDHSAHAPSAVGQNWARNITFAARRLHTPASVAELQEIVATGSAIRALGTGHSFNTVADTEGELVSVAGLPRVVEIDPSARTATVSAGLRFGEFTGELHRNGLALHNLGSLPHISVAGACATGTHGSGVTNRALAGAVRALEIVTADGALAKVGRGDADFPGAVVSLGALGVVTRVTLDLVPAFEIRQWVYEGLPQDQLLGRFDEVMSEAYSVSLFTSWRDDPIDQVWLKRRTGASAPGTAPRRWLGATLAEGPRHPVPGMPARHCTEQEGTPGPWHARLPHFRLEFTPSNGDELQSEYFVDRSDAAAAYQALDRIREQIAPLLQIGEIRTVAADDLWLSPAQGRDSVAFHFTWVPDGAAVAPVVAAVEEALAPFAARPHWGKVFSTPPGTLRGLYDHYADFERLTERWDPRGTFRNDFLARHFPRAAGGPEDDGAAG
ncbi:FAD-binding protein [Streptomyces sp. SID8360]|nr:FAD linked oxidase domain protein [Streptomyces sp. SirexAA-E]MYR66751.1 FAD-binding protein [Streptomyces sp. SID4939]MYS03556.1 FAD-binding protein [Streptomyces sp. SID4940]MYT65963.1 FAD-binding protein [Streptomyces sp. SID8357]MYT85523.1 FAD-binding protein [Streptomyces sp. SID8360]MYW41672.1 FAD-binding protein [Streptomyces sp. SID1]PZX33124.1 xylitol oxidase [Streptomyces sp. DvalAA-21]RAJ26081.1 xylitol oxidase [Streptomyces sp. DpondAA-E10]RAJ39831.1 xylitol oxidase [Streptom